ncbi:spidroin-2-like [Eptesicus fuscus]|uniref:spidroin-2-like n=1 Tax=Eptesicus fuscus TaxID=29078 RepID=UPI00240426CA|nr:spidroin-2-like [Eptesicus fuscus]
MIKRISTDKFQLLSLALPGPRGRSWHGGAAAAAAAGIAAWGRRRSAGHGVPASALRARGPASRGPGRPGNVRRSPRASVSARGGGTGAGLQPVGAPGARGPGSGAQGTLRGAARPGLPRTAVLSNSPPPPQWGPALPEDPVRICEERNVMKKEQKRAVIVGERGVFFPSWWLLHDWKRCTWVAEEIRFF